MLTGTHSSCQLRIYTWVISALGCAPYDLTSKTCWAFVDANTNSKEIVAMLKFFPILLSLFPFFCQFVVRNDGNHVWFEAIYTSILELHTIETTQLILTNLMQGC